MPLVPRVGWKRSKKGNLYQRFADGTTATVFRFQNGRREGEYGYCVYTEEWGKQFADDSWETETDAIEAVMVDIAGEVA